MLPSNVPGVSKNVLTKDHFLHTLYKRASEQISIEEMLMLTHVPNEKLPKSSQILGTVLCNKIK